MFGINKFYNIHVLSLQFKKTLQEVYPSDEVWRYCSEKLPMIIKFLSLMGVNINTWYMYICTYFCLFEVLRAAKIFISRPEGQPRRHSQLLVQKISLTHCVNHRVWIKCILWKAGLHLRRCRQPKRRLKAWKYLVKVLIAARDCVRN